MKYWLLKSEPETFSIDDLQLKMTAVWDGVRNYQARNLIRDEIRLGDLAFFYHSSDGKSTGIVGEMRIASVAYMDPSQFDKNSQYYDSKSTREKPRWWSVDVDFVAKFSRPVLLSEIRFDSKFGAFTLLQKGNRLSVHRVSDAHYQYIKELVESKVSL